MALFSSDDGYPAPGKISKRRYREMKKMVREMTKAIKVMREKMDRDLAKALFKTP